MLRERAQAHREYVSAHSGSSHIQAEAIDAVYESALTRNALAHRSDMSEILTAIGLAHDCIAPGNWETDNLLNVLEAANTTAFGRQIGESARTGPELLFAVKTR